MSRSPVELSVGGQTYRVVASAEESELHRLADVVDAKLRELVAPGRYVAPQTILLAALALAHELEDERRRHLEVEQRTREKLSSLLGRIDTVLAETAVPPAQSSVAPVRVDS
ncbi:MAG: cell division protein ZapA [Polyangiaceae bacterium]|nr:cell division protein ZapA [Polyangiaceae bacterium]